MTVQFWPAVIVPTSAVREGTVFVALGGKAVARPVKVGYDQRRMRMSSCR